MRTIVLGVSCFSLVGLFDSADRRVLVLELLLQLLLGFDDLMEKQSRKFLQIWEASHGSHEESVVHKLGDVAEADAACDAPNPSFIRQDDRVDFSYDVDKAVDSRRLEVLLQSL